MGLGDVRDVRWVVSGIADTDGDELVEAALVGVDVQGEACVGESGKVGIDAEREGRASGGAASGGQVRQDGGRRNYGGVGGVHGQVRGDPGEVQFVAG